MLGRLIYLKERLLVDLSGWLFSRRFRRFRRFRMLMKGHLCVDPWTGFVNVNLFRVGGWLRPLAAWPGEA